MPASAKTLTAILNNPQRWYKKNAKNFDKLPARVQIFFIMRMRGIDFKMSQKLAEKLSPKLSSEWQSFLWGQPDGRRCRSLLSCRESRLQEPGRRSARPDGRMGRSRLHA